LKREVDLIVSHCGQLLTLARLSDGPRRGKDLADLGLVRNGVLAASKGKVIAAGPADSVMPGVQPVSGCVEIDAGGAYRLDEYEQRIRGVPYAEIAKSGGGIAKSVADLRKTDETALLAMSLERLNGCLMHGTTTIEIKSGYGLDLDNELKQLRVIRGLAERCPALIVSTFLGAHSIPPDFRDRREEYIQLVVGEMIPAVAGEGLAEFIDVFSEIGAFDTSEAERILRAGVKAGLRARVHADELCDTSSTAMAVRVGAVSADHLERISPGGMSLLADSSVIGVLLPGASFGLPSLHFAPAREMVERGVAVAIATDFNPGSSPSESMPMMIAIACSHMRLSPAEAIAAATYNAAFVVSREHEVGSLDPGKRADFLVLDCDDYREIPYRFGVNPVRRVFIEGTQWAGNGPREGR
jgi:imidazolonepropionase